MFSLRFLTEKELSTGRHFIVWAAKLNQHVYDKGNLTSKFESRDMLHWKWGVDFVSTEDENLCAASTSIWFDRSRSPERLP